MSLIYQCEKNTLPIAISNIFFKRKKQTIYNLRNVIRLDVPFARLAKTTFFVTIYGPKLWNELQNEMINCKNLIIFRKTIKKMYISSYNHDMP